MKNFVLLKKAIDTGPLLAEINQQADPWGGQTGRQDKIKVQREALSIPLRGLQKSKIAGRKRWDVHESRFTTTSKRFPLAIKFIKSFAAERDGKLSRAKLVNLQPGCRVYDHIDRGDYYRIRDRYHLVLQTGEGCYLTSGEEVGYFNQGELWWFDNKRSHEAYNPSQIDRIHLVFDLLPKKPLEHAS